MRNIFNNSQSAKVVNRARSKRVFALLFSAVLCTSLIPCVPFFNIIVSAAELYTLGDEVILRSGPGTYFEVLETLDDGYPVEYICSETDSQGNVWYKVNVDNVEGYIYSDILSELPENTIIEDVSEQEVIDADVQTYEEPYNSGSENPTTEIDTVNENDETVVPVVEEDVFVDDSVDLEALYTPGSQPQWSGIIQSEEEFEAQLAQFPESYQDGLRAVHEEFPNYTFKADYIDMDFETLVDAQFAKKIYDGAPASWKAMYDESFGWFENYDWVTGEWYYSEGFFTYASREVIEYYLDPRNFLDIWDVYMFMRQSYSESQTIDDLRSIFYDSFLAEGYTPNKNDPDDVRLKGDFAEVIMEAAKLSGINPFVLASTILLEQGRDASVAPLARGYYTAEDDTKYEGYFNFFDIGATGSDNDNVLVNGFEYAIAHGWSSRYKCIVDGALWMADAYINNCQDTYYYRECNVRNGWDELWHQYSTSITTAVTSGQILREAVFEYPYAALEFRIPVYNNMPSSPAAAPEGNENLNNYYFTNMQASGLEPAFTMDNRDYFLTISGDTTLTVGVPEGAVYESDKSFSLGSGTTAVQLDIRSQTGYLRTYNIAVTSSCACTLTVKTVAGIKTKSGLSPGDEGWADANGDGKTSALDYIAIKNHIMGTSEITDTVRLTAADANGDGKVSALDYVAIKNYIMSK